MTLRNKTLLIVALTLVALFAAVFGGTAYILRQGFSDLESGQMRKDALRTQLAIKSELDQVESISHSYAIRDEAVEFVLGNAPGFAERHLNRDTFDNLKIDLLIYADHNGVMRFSASYDPKTREPTMMANKTHPYVNARDGLLFNRTSTQGKHGLLRVGSSLMLFGSHPVMRSAEDTGNHGTVIIARVLDTEALERIGKLIQLDLAVSSVVGELEPDFAQAWDNLKHGETGPYLAPLDSDTFAAYHVLLDQTRKPVALLRMTAPRAVHAQLVSTLNYLVVALVVIGVIFIAVTLLNLERLVLARLERLASDVNNIALGGDMTGRVNVHGSDELAALAENINKLLANLESQIDLENAVSNAQIAAQAKSTFLANMSHELRTPLNAIIGYSELVRDSAADNGLSGVEPDLRKIVDAAKHLQSIIADVLDISKIEAGKMELEATAFDVRETVNAVRDIVAMRANEKNLDLFIHVSRHVPLRIVGDAARLRQILVNLINNAVKFTERGNVDVSVDAKAAENNEGWELQFSVRDTGIGIPAQRFDRLFKAFSQVDPSSSRKYGGTGLGLAISKQLCEMMGGKMWAESIEGVGSTFHFTIKARLAV